MHILISKYFLGTSGTQCGNKFGASEKVIHARFEKGAGEEESEIQ